MGNLINNGFSAFDSGHGLDDDIVDVDPWFGLHMSYIGEESPLRIIKEQDDYLNSVDIELCLKNLDEDKITLKCYFLAQKPGIESDARNQLQKALMHNIIPQWFWKWRTIFEL